MHLANFCFDDERFEAELARLAADSLANSWFSNQVNERALLATDGLTLRQAHALSLCKNEGLAPMPRNASRTSSSEARGAPDAPSTAAHLDPERGVWRGWSAAARALQIVNAA